MTYRLLGTGVCLLKSALCVRRFHGRKKTGSDMTLPVTDGCGCARLSVVYIGPDEKQADLSCQYQTAAVSW